MRKTINFFTVIVMAITLFLTGLGSFGVNISQASALASGYNPEVHSVYYFYNDYPTLGPTIAASDLGENSIFYDYKPVNGTGLANLVDNGYFDGFNEGTIVVIDLKSILPDENNLSILFKNLQQTQGCTTIFVSSIDRQDFYDGSFFTWVDFFIYDDYDGFKSVIISLLTDYLYYNNNNIVKNSCILIDGNMIRIDEDHNGDINFLYESNVFVRLLIDALSYINNIPKNADMFYTLSNDYNIKILVYRDYLADMGAYEFFDILTRTKYDVVAIEDFQNYNENGEPLNYLCAMGFWSLDQGFYDLLFEQQETLGAIPVYIVEKDPIIIQNDLSLSIILGDGGPSARALLTLLKGLL